MTRAICKDASFFIGEMGNCISVYTSEAWHIKWCNPWQRNSSSNSVTSTLSLSILNIATLRYQPEYAILEEHKIS
jgi:hypothetical protein